VLPSAKADMYYNPGPVLKPFRLMSFESAESE